MRKPIDHRKRVGAGRGRALGERLTRESLTADNWEVVVGSPGGGPRRQSATLSRRDGSSHRLSVTRCRPRFAEGVAHRCLPVSTESRQAPHAPYERSGRGSKVTRIRVMRPAST